MNQQGRITIPIELRKALNLQPEQALVIGLEDSKLVIQDKANLEQEMLSFFKRQKEQLKVKGSIVDEFISERRKEASSE